MVATPHEIAISIAKSTKERDFNEADTRHKIIDEVLHGVLNWPKTQTLHESYIKPGYADYRLKRSNGDDLVFLEAKKEGVYFELPNNFNGGKNSRHILVKTLMTDPNIKSAIEQVRVYCMEEGCEFAGITNGHEWVFFKTFERGKNWRNLKALVIKKNDFFSDNFIEAINTLGYESIKSGSLKHKLGTIGRQNRELFYPKDKIVSYDHEVSSNIYARDLRPFARKYFGAIDVSEKEFLESCYVNEREYESAFENFRGLIKDSLTPYFEERGVQDLKDNEKGGSFGNRIAKSLQSKKNGEVIVLFGGKGAGKSTFLKKLLYHNPPQYLAKHSRVAIADLLNVPENKPDIHFSIWDQLITSLDTEELLSKDRVELLALFDDRYQLAKRQILFGLEDGSENYNLRLNELVKEWLEDKKYVANRLVAYWKSKHKGCIIAVDNTDQFPHDLQDFCFTTAQEIADTLGCLVIISMREERFHASRIHGTLDAYQNSGFHISSPVTKAVFEKRIDFVIKKLNDDAFCQNEFYVESSSPKIQSIKKLFVILRNEFKKGDKSPLTDFLNACAHGNIRLALELFRDFLKSGYTNVDEMVGITGLWTLRIHQVLKPVMIPYRFFYEEVQSSIPNIFQVRNKKNGSHFTALRILHKLSDGIDPANPFYISIGELKEHFSEKFNMVEDFEKNIDIFLKWDLVESNNRLDSYSSDVDSIKITNYGIYIYETLSSFFTYIELVASDCGVYDETTANDIVSLSNEDFRLFNKRKRVDRVKTRLKKAQQFIEYLSREELLELEFYGEDNHKFMPQIAKRFEDESNAVMKSATRQR
ncbi:hypothetical protein Q4575_06670 [Psychrosphaera sp. 1_MG-2023]|uniref:hypothetical protein n=1 Tax=Psychrosphaera sp. 1_MG-2023 TaxID=3062643 RepID=UPI0026E3383D|nr:hypothetical protein [Psychrosphaera sp. 1_MG-2023]MDO6719075.1 hypothetical protein [Psychrosphaera sp. 1_MG-2023]